MALFIRQQGPRSELQERVVAEMQDRIRKRSEEDVPAPTVGAEAYDHSDQHETRLPGVIITVLMIVLVVAIIWWASTRQQ
jgi:hypothetical protein